MTFNGDRIAVSNISSSEKISQISLALPNKILRIRTGNPFAERFKLDRNSSTRLSETGANFRQSLHSPEQNKFSRKYEQISRTITMNYSNVGEARMYSASLEKLAIMSVYRTDLQPATICNATRYARTWNVFRRPRKRLSDPFSRTNDRDFDTRINEFIYSTENSRIK